MLFNLPFQTALSEPPPPPAPILATPCLDPANEAKIGLPTPETHAETPHNSFPAESFEEIGNGPILVNSSPLDMCVDAGSNEALPAEVPSAKSPPVAVTDEISDALGVVLPDAGNGEEEGEEEEEVVEGDHVQDLLGTSVDPECDPETVEEAPPESLPKAALDEISDAIDGQVPLDDGSGNEAEEEEEEEEEADDDENSQGELALI